MTHKTNRQKLSLCHNGTLPENKFKPSIITDDGTKPWIWVRGPGYKSPYKEEDAVEAILEGVMKRVSLPPATPMASLALNNVGFM